MQICYGMTETSPVSTQTLADTPFEKQVGTVGVVQDHLEIKIIDPETGRSRNRNTAGEFCTRGYSIMLGYWNNPKASSMRLLTLRDGCIPATLPTMDDEGYVNIVGRIGT